MYQKLHTHKNKATSRAKYLWVVHAASESYLIGCMSCVSEVGGDEYKSWWGGGSVYVRGGGTKYVSFDPSLLDFATSLVTNQ